MPCDQDENILMLLAFANEEQDIYPFTALSRINEYSKQLTYQNRLFQLIRNAIQIQSDTNAGIISRIPSYQKWMLRKELLAYYEFFKKEFDRVPEIAHENRMFLMKACEEVRAAMELILHITQEEDPPAFVYWREVHQQHIESITQPNVHSANMVTNEVTEANKGDPIDIRNWGVDSGVTSHFTPFLYDLKDVVDCDVNVMLADGSTVHGAKMGNVILNIVTNKGKKCQLTLKRVIYVEGLQRRLFSVMSFQGEGGRLQFGDGHTVPITFDAFRSNPDLNNKEALSQTEVVGIGDVTQPPNMTKDASTNEPSNSKSNESRNNPTTQDLETWHPRLAFAPLRYLLSGSENQIWNDVKFRLASGTFNSNCKISVIPKTALSKKKFPKAQKTFQRIFVDIKPGMSKGVSPDTEFASCLLIVDQFTRWIAMKGMQGSTAPDEINAVKEWGSTIGGLSKLEVIEYIRSDAGNQITENPSNNSVKTPQLNLN